MVSKFYIAGLERGQIRTNGQYTGKYMLLGEISLLNIHNLK